MKINQTFDITFNVDKYPKEDKSINYEGVLSDKVEKVDLKFTLSEKEAGYFLFKFYPGFFKLGDYQVGMIFDETHKLKTIVFTKEESFFILEINSSKASISN